MITRTLAHNYPIVRRKCSLDGSEIVIVKREHKYHPFIVWKMYPDGVCVSGGYHETLREANEDYFYRR